ncbi:MAG: 50S ribosomal protein L25 [Anaerolineales bacterium]
MSNTIALNAQKREIIGKQVKQLRRAGIVPAVVYGPLHEKPIAVQIPWKSLRPIIAQAGGTSVIEMDLEGEAINVLIKTVERHPVRRDVMHVDFYAVDVTELFRVEVPLVVPDAEALGKRLEARVFQPMNRIEIEVLPQKIPNEIVIDESFFQEAGDIMTVADLPQIEGLEYLANPELPVVRTVSLELLAARMDAQLEGEEEEFEKVEPSPEVEVIGRGREEEEEEF